MQFSTSILKIVKSRGILWGLVALAAHTAWGLYPALARYLQTVSHLPTFAMATVGNGIVLILLMATIFPRLDKTVFRQPVLWGFSLIVVCRSVTNLLSARFTLAIYVQVVNLLVPFLVALLSTSLYRERLPRSTIPALLLSLLGALLIVTSDTGSAGLQLSLTSSDWLGIGLAATSGVFLAFYMIIIRRSFRQQISGDAIFLAQIIALTSVMGASSLVTQENWGIWSQLQPTDWLVFALFITVALVFANYGQIMALKHLPAPLVSGLLPWRLVSALAGGFLLLGEQLTTLWQYLGAVIILGTLSWYLSRQSEG